jgi:predicted RNA binding protein YcfA (HicA-like mRNA interferase family)
LNDRELLRRLRQGNVSNVAFNDFGRLTERFGFELERTAGSHRILRHGRLGIRMNLQAVRGEAKPYQIRQFLQLLERYGLGWDEAND